MRTDCNAGPQKFRIAKCGIANFDYAGWFTKFAFRNSAFRNSKDLPMINEKKTSELLETSLIYLLSAAVAVGAFVLVWLISLVLGPGRA